MVHVYFISILLYIQFYKLEEYKPIKHRTIDKVQGEKFYLKRFYISVTRFVTQITGVNFLL